MCYDTYERLLIAQKFRRAADQSRRPDRDEPAKAPIEHPAQTATPNETPIRKKEPA
jgi:hypothetical protein